MERAGNIEAAAKLAAVRDMNDGDRLTYDGTEYVVETRMVPVGTINDNFEISVRYEKEYRVYIPKPPVVYKEDEYYEDEDGFMYRCDVDEHEWD